MNLNNYNDFRSFVKTLILTGYVTNKFANCSAREFDKENMTLWLLEAHKIVSWYLGED